MAMQKGCGLIFPAGSSKPITFVAPPYWYLPEINARADPNPYYSKR
jgi:hypothetical protein